MAKYYSTKTYSNEIGLSCCFRQWKSTHSHCSYLHGYSIGVKLIFESDTLDERNWVQDFGGLKQFKDWLKDTFDHTTLVAQDDPSLEYFKTLHSQGLEEGATKLIDLRIVPAVGCEKFAELAYNRMNTMLQDNVINGTSLNPNVRLKSVEVFEHGANSATYEG